MKLALLGIVINAGLSVIKLLAGYFGHSYALIADGIESTLDIAGSFIIWGGLKLAMKPPDADHPYGHGKAEPMASIIVALLVLLAATGLAAESVREILTPHHAPASFTLIVLVVVVLTKETLYRIVMWQGKKTGSVAIQTDAGHHRADVITSIAAFVGISIALMGGKGWEPADDWAALFACLLIARNGIGMLKPALDEIMDTAPPKNVYDEIRRIASAVPGVENVESCRIRKMGVEFYVDLHVWVDGNIPVREGHSIAHEVKDAVKESNPAVADVLVHVEPRLNSGGNIITKEDIIGARVTDVFERYGSLADDLDHTQTYYMVDRGFCFMMPSPGAPWEKTPLPKGLEKPDRKVVDAMRKRAISGVFFKKPDGDGFIDPHSVRIHLDDGTWFWSIPVAPKGTGQTGLHYVTTPDAARDALIDFWDIPLDNH